MGALSAKTYNKDMKELYDRLAEKEKPAEQIPEQKTEQDL